VLTVNFTSAAKGITVPYAALHDKIRRNHGFVDSRGRPDLADQIPELRRSDALKALVLTLSAPGSVYFSLGCDLGSHKDNEYPPVVAGGYIQIAATQFHTATKDEYVGFAKFLCTHMESKSNNFLWKLNLEYASVQFKLDGFDEIFPSVQMWFFARAKTERLAETSREALIAAIHDAFTAYVNRDSGGN